MKLLGIFRLFLNKGGIQFMFVFFMNSSAIGQTFSISGKIQDINEKPVDQVNIRLTNKVSNQENFSHSNGKGEYKINLPLGTYVVNFSKVGQQSNIIELKLLTDTLVNLKMLAVDVKLDSIVITGRTKLFERKVDRLVLNVDNSIIAMGGTVLDALKLIPSVKINNESIAVLGKSTLKVMIDEKIIPLSGSELISFLNGISSSNISKIEYISNPPAQYDAEGNAGLINIILKKNKFENVVTTVRSSYQKASHSTGTHGGNINYRKGKFSAIADLSYSYGKSLYSNSIRYHYPIENWENEIENINKKNNLTSLFNLQYTVTNKTTIGIQYLGSFQRNNAVESSINNAFINSQLNKSYETNGSSIGKGRNNSLNFNVTHSLDSLGKKVSIDLDYFNGVFPKNNDFHSLLNNLGDENEDQLLAHNNSKQYATNKSVKLDFTLPYKWGNVSFGGKGSFSNIKNVVSTQFIDLLTNELNINQNDDFGYSENNQSLYFTVNKSFGKKFDSKVGIRAENTLTRAENFVLNSEFKNSYFKVFPTAYFSYKIDDNNYLMANFGSRIQRPNYSDLNPARWYLSPQSYVVGNPYLEPSFMYNFELSYLFRNMLYVKLNHGILDQNIGQLTNHDVENDIQVFRRLNFAKGKFYSLVVSLNRTFLSRIESTLDLYGAYTTTNPYDSITILDRRYTGWTGMLNLSNSIKLDNKNNFFGTVDFQFTPASRADVNKISSSSNLNLGLKYLLFNKNLILGLAMEDVFKNNISKINNFTSGIPQSYRQYYDTRFIRLSISYKIGNKKIAVDRRTFGNEEEKNRSQQN